MNIIFSRIALIVLPLFALSLGIHLQPNVPLSNQKVPMFAWTFYSTDNLTAVQSVGYIFKLNITRGVAYVYMEIGMKPTFTNYTAKGEKVEGYLTISDETRNSVKMFPVCV